MAEPVRIWPSLFYAGVTEADPLPVSISIATERVDDTYIEWLSRLLRRL